MAVLSCSSPAQRNIILAGDKQYHNLGLIPPNKQHMAYAVLEEEEEGFYILASQQGCVLGKLP